MFTGDILHKYFSNLASPLVLTKSDGSIRITYNFKRLNDGTVTPMLPIPTMDVLLDELGHSHVSRVLDLVNGVFQTTINEDSIPVTAVCTTSGLSEWLRMPLGTTGSPGWFQFIMARVCEGLNSFARITRVR